MDLIFVVAILFPLCLNDLLDEDQAELSGLLAFFLRAETPYVLSKSLIGISLSLC